MRIFRKRVTRILLGIVLGFSIILQYGSSVSLAGNKVTNEYIQEKEAEIKQVQKEQKELKNGIDAYKGELKKLKQQQEDLAAYVEEVDAAILELEGNIADMSQKIEAKEAEIEQVKAELQEAQETREAQYEAMKVRIRFMYEEGDNYALELLFSAQGFSDMLNKADYIASISEYDREKLDEYIMNEKLIETIQAELESQEELLLAEKEGLEEEQKAQEELAATAESNMIAMQADIDETNQTIEQLNAELAAQTETIEALEKAVAAERKRLEEENRKVQTYDGGAFIWPVPSCSKISSPYGWRLHPILKVNRFHNGIDIPGKGGADIIAAYDGVIVAASYTSSMGNYLMVDHGGGLYTIYMHCSKFYVKNGQSVQRGETIAAVGTTGLSTGNHLHFSVRKNGEYQDPLSYVSQP